jgi:hypothetical protein
MTRAAQNRVPQDRAHLEYALAALLALAVLVLRAPETVLTPALWPDDFNYLIHVLTTGEPVWYYINLAGTKGYVSLLPMLESWAFVHWAPAWLTPWLFVGSSMIWVALAQALPVHPISNAVLTTPTQRRMACLLLIMLPVSTMGEVVALAIQHVTFLMIAAWMVAMCAGPNDWVDRLRPLGLLTLSAALVLAMWSAPTAFVLAPVALIALIFKFRAGRLLSGSGVVLIATIVSAVGFLIFGAKPGPSFLYQGILQPLGEGAVVTAIGGFAELVRLTIAFVLDAVAFDLVFGSHAKLFLGRGFEWGYPLVYLLGAGILIWLGWSLHVGDGFRGRAAPGRVALLAIAVMLVAINLAARWEPDNTLAQEGFRYWRWRYFTVSEWLVASVLAVVLASSIMGSTRRWAAVGISLWLIALNLTNQAKYTDFFKHEMHDDRFVSYRQIEGGEFARRAAGTRQTMALIEAIRRGEWAGGEGRIRVTIHGHELDPATVRPRP